jgi:hypothetical protein
MARLQHIYINNTLRQNDELLPLPSPEDGKGRGVLEFSFENAVGPDGTPSSEYVPDDIELVSLSRRGDIIATGHGLMKRERQEEYFDDNEELKVRIGYEDFRLYLDLLKNQEDEYQESEFTLTLMARKFASEHTDQMVVMEEGFLTFTLTLLADVDMGDDPEVPDDYDPEDAEQAAANAEEIAKIQDEVAEGVSDMLSSYSPPIDISGMFLPILLVKSGGNMQIANVLRQLREMRAEIRKLKYKEDASKALKEELEGKAEALEEDERRKHKEDGGSRTDPFEPSYKVRRFEERAEKAERDEQRYAQQDYDAVEEYKAFVRLHILEESSTDSDAVSEIRGKYPSGTNIFIEDMESSYGEDVTEWDEDDIDRGVREYMLRELVTGGLGRMVKEKLNQFKQQFAAVASGVKDLMTTAQTTFMEPMGAMVATPTGPGSVAANIPQVFNSLKRLNASAMALLLPITAALESARFLGLPKEVVTPLVRMTQIVVAINEIAGAM